MLSRMRTSGGAAVRELQEESDYSTVPEDLIDLGIVAPEAGVIKGRTRLFVAVVTRMSRRAAAGELGHGKMAFTTKRKLIILSPKVRSKRPVPW